MSEIFGELNGAPAWVPAVLLVTLSLAAGFLIRFLLLRVIRYWQSRDRKLFKSLELHLRGSMFLFIPLLLINVGVNYINIAPRSLPFITTTLNIFIIMSLCSILIRMTNVAQDMLFIRYDINLSNNLRARKIRTQIMYVKKVAIVLLVFICLVLILLNFPAVRKFGTTILAGAGVAGIIIGFALQKSLVNLFAGIQIAFTQPIKIDDAVVVENEWGWIEEINLTYVVVRIWDLRRLVLPITYFTENAFQNWTRNNAQILGSVFLYLDYSMPLEPLRAHFEKVLSETKLWDGEAKVLQVTDTSEKTMTIRLLMTAQNSPTAWDLRCYVREKMIEFVQQNYPQSLPHVRATLAESAAEKPVAQKSSPNGDGA
ncbi:mechanosensitive ion channel family protein [Pluralibacter gergoviae]|uniref:Mechanosensitive ion channel family protein n=1 Tax=Pluralibacter gergoviae TaxID=61647 RepID=A0AAI9DHG8_PLUGE|nr:mechanosensitive ion channel family protein [Pluralibacter gergoviae]EKV0913515.1 mechanosensitive ion channel family protein [Pluralibacter gergoviae]EKV9906089.1 mechanosensitive ion channel family protein [Pluralibacter gergoviae]EKW7274096.1 mechanosensitive ion channel family protein [Pluralibacter gergoviae]ELD4293626.1 mechanosensitive ion channel family protein [Pluralibacter gergoviae]ELD4304405.1 mechanosensitive ion channel family protein [Pluralibacter gergoviae]